ncbi:helix-turn-helix transcriptional regulator [Sphaerisporangium sp. NPDC051011]|uniref:helix-turn-helix domain-containing protein n=1 Tax=Sphaerisporangium sp. NPDC051011 TaxID=3155792 RepID=UPI0033EC4229
MPAGSADPRKVPASVWQLPAMIAALRARDMGHVLRLVRQYAGMSQTAIGIATGFSQGKVSEIMKGAIQVSRLDVFERIAAGLAMPDPARISLGLAPVSAEAGAMTGRPLSPSPTPPSDQPSEVDADPGLTAQHISLRSLTSATSAPIVTGLRRILTAQIEAEAMMGPQLLMRSIIGQVPIIERVCQVAKGTDRHEALSFGSEFLEFFGWLYQDSGNYIEAMRWTNKALDYAMEMGDHHVISYILMRKSNIAAESGDHAHGLGLANAALTNAGALTPRLRAVVLRARANAHAHLGDLSSFAEDSEAALSEAIAGVNQEESDRARYCTPAYIEMEAGASWLLLGRAANALPIFEDSRSRWIETSQVRDQALCLARLATAYAVADEPERACLATDDALTLTHVLGSGRVLSQLKTLRRRLAKWSAQDDVADLLTRLDIVTAPPSAPTTSEGPW